MTKCSKRRCFRSWRPFWNTVPLQSSFQNDSTLGCLSFKIPVTESIISLYIEPRSHKHPPKLRNTCKACWCGILWKEWCLASRRAYIMYRIKFPHVSGACFVAGYNLISIVRTTSARPFVSLHAEAGLIS